MIFLSFSFSLSSAHTTNSINRTQNPSHTLAPSLTLSPRLERNVELPQQPRIVTAAGGRVGGVVRCRRGTRRRGQEQGRPRRQPRQVGDGQATQLLLLQRHHLVRQGDGARHHGQERLGYHHLGGHQGVRDVRHRASDDAAID